jgi:hypothetical protein
MSKKLAIVVCELALFVLVVDPIHLFGDDNWPQFRGAKSTGVVDGDANLPTTWSATENVAWKTDTPGRGWSSPVVWGDQIFLTTVINSGESEEPTKGL